MKEHEMNLLICTDGSPAAEEAAKLVTRLGFPEDTQITLLGVSETERDQTNLLSSMDRIIAALGGLRPGLTRTLRHGPPVDEILRELQAQSYNLVAVGERGHHRGLSLLKLGSTAGKLARRINTHLLVARNVPEKINKILVCTGAESPSVDTIQRTGKLIAGMDAEVSLLHVMSQVFFGPQSRSDDLLDTAESAIARDTREGRHLKLAMEQLEKTGVSAPIKPLLRHGLVVDKVLAEVNKEKSNLLVIGAHHQPGQNRWQEILLDDVADQLLNQAPCSVLVV
jgi:nucleotide-binding universal stress UspA family protein